MVHPTGFEPTTYCSGGNRSYTQKAPKKAKMV